MSGARDHRGGGVLQVQPQVHAGGSLITRVEVAVWGEPDTWGALSLPTRQARGSAESSGGSRGLLT